MEHARVKLGRYKHFKGGEVEVTGIAKHSETLEEMVLYRHTEPGGPTGFWVRPLKIFLEEVEVDGKKMPRFKYLEK